MSNVAHSCVCVPNIFRVWLVHYARRVIATVAPAEAKSCRALALLVVTLGRLLLLGVVAAPIVLVRLLAVEASPLTVDCLRCAVFLMGLEPDTSLLLIPVACLKLVTGGSGRGLEPAEGVVMVLCRLIGESVRAVNRAVGTDDFCPVKNSCLTASSGFIRLSGSQRRHRVRKSRKASSSHFRTCCRVFEDGFRRRPFEETVSRGFPIESKNNFFRVLFSIKCFSGGPKTSMMHANCSCSFSPGNIGYPVYNSANMQPTLHMSIGIP